MRQDAHVWIGDTGEARFRTPDRQAAPLVHRLGYARRRTRSSRGIPTSDIGGAIRRRVRDRFRRCDDRTHIWLARGVDLLARRRTGPTGAPTRYLGHSALVSAMRLANQAGWPVESKRLHLAPSVVPVVLTIARGPRAGLSSMRASDPLFRKHLRCDPCRRPASLAAQPTPVARRQNHLQAMRVCIRQVGARGFILGR